MEQRDVHLRGRRFSYVDFGGDGEPIVALHGTFGRGRTFADLASRLAPAYRVIALDQRGHGLSQRGGAFGRDEFVGDTAEFIRHLGLQRTIVLGHSLGGVNAYQLAARHPELVRALAVADIGAVTDSTEVPNPIVDVSGWPRTAASREELEASYLELGLPAPDYFLDSVVEEDGQWRMAFDHDDMMATQHCNLGSWWEDWTSSTCPALLVRAANSSLLLRAMAERMARQRPDTTLVELPGTGHWLYQDDPAGFALAVERFLSRAAR
ncbi:alpha/beta hydrolase [Allokutzneria sp. A3M-2-11 16]|uniref:alpha/beta fold hydrolase n=1 Tax=Allokutzneria sp. A3M-2-11 16 TaxID=2962043 RepID=UPI0020B6652E|nr:alpha/beta hydrolase [Allokutzneria sp. A3M-2-11 16]MCP3803942.1 alpha/beta hydrolase [Allokutzneria sp. A3M-2-11 16]